MGRSQKGRETFDVYRAQIRPKRRYHAGATGTPRSATSSGRPKDRLGQAGGSLASAKGMPHFYRAPPGTMALSLWWPHST